MRYWADIDDDPPTLIRSDTRTGRDEFLDPATGEWVFDPPYVSGVSVGAFDAISVDEARRLAAQHGHPEAVPAAA